MAHHEKIKKFLESKGLEVIVDLDQSEDLAESSDRIGESYVGVFQSLYNRLYDDIVGFDLVPKLTLTSFYNEADRGPEGVNARFALNKTNAGRESVWFDESFGDSWVRYMTFFDPEKYSDVFDFAKNCGFMAEHYTTFENIFKKTVDPNGTLTLKEKRRNNVKGMLYIEKRFDIESRDPRGNSISIFPSKEGYCLELQFMLDRDNRNKVYGAVKELRKIFNQYSG